MMTEIRFFVPGTPQPGGSKSAVVIAGRARIFDDCKRNKDWRAVVSMAAVEHFREGPLDCPLFVRFEFLMPRPKGHFGSGKNRGRLRSSAPLWPAVKPDVTKLIRSTEDALTGIAWRDDALIVKQVGDKQYVNPELPVKRLAGAWITIRHTGLGR